MVWIRNSPAETVTEPLFWNTESMYVTVPADLLMVPGLSRMAPLPLVPQ